MNCLIFVIGLMVTAEDPVIIDKVAIKVNDKIVTQRELVLKYQQQVQPLIDNYVGPDLDAKLNDMWQQVVEGTIEQLLLYEKAIELGLSISPETLESRMQSLKESSGYTDDEFEELLAAQTGMTLAEYVDFAIRDESAQRVVHSQVLAAISVEDSEISKYYDEHLSQYMIPAKYRIAEIVFLKEGNPSAAHIRALACEESLANGTAFEEAAKRYSDSASKDNGGDLGEVEYGDLNADIEDRVKQLEIGSVSEVIESSSAYFIVKVLDKIDSRPRPIDEVKEEISNTLRAPRLEMELHRFINDLKDTFLVETLVKEPPKL